MRQLPVILAVILAVLSVGATSLTDQQPLSGSAKLPYINPAIGTALTCTELLSLLHAQGDNRSGGTAILWLDGYYSGHSGLTEFSAGWLRTVSSGCWRNPVSYQCRPLPARSWT